MRLRTGAAGGARLRAAAGDHRARHPARAEPAHARQRRGSLPGPGTGRPRRGDRRGPAGSELSGASWRRVARTAAAAVRGRVLIVNARRDRDRRQRRQRASSAPATRRGRRSPARSAAGSVQLQRASRTLGEEILATAVPVIHNRATVGAVRITQSVASVHSAVSRVELGLGADRRVVLALGLLVGGVIARPDRAPTRPARAGRRRSSPTATSSARAPVEGSREQRSLGVSFNVMTDRIRAPARLPARVRRRRLPSAANAADGAASAVRGGHRRRREYREPRRRARGRHGRGRAARAASSRSCSS